MKKKKITKNLLANLKKKKKKNEKTAEKFSKKLKRTKLFRQIFVKIKNFGKCADKFSKI